MADNKPQQDDGRCCSIMTMLMSGDCPSHPDPLHCPDAVIVQGPDGSAYYSIKFCPFCGAGC